MNIPEKVGQLLQRLKEVRKKSLEATRQGDYRQVAKLTTEAAGIQKKLGEIKGMLG